MKEYRTIREEMMMRFGFMHYLLIGTVAFVGALVYYAYQIYGANPKGSQINPQLLSLIVLTIVTFSAHWFLTIIRSIGNQGSYLAVYHELKGKTKWHLRSRLVGEMAKDLFEKVRWGKEAATAGIIYGMTYILSKAMLLLLPENKTLSGPMAMIHNKVAIAEIVVGIFFVAIICKLFLAGNWMKNNMKLWWQYYNRYENKDSGFTEDFEGTIENLRVLGTSRTAGLLKLWVPVIVWMAVIFFFSGIPDLRSGLKYDFILRKIVHIIEYFILTLLLYRAFKDSLKLDIQRLFVYPFGLSYLYAVSDEVHQSFVPGRTCTVRDLLIDVVGMIGFYLALRALAKRACAKNAQIG